MELIEEFKTLIGKTIENNDFASTEQLLKAFLQTGLEADGDILYLFSLYCYCTGQYSISMYWAELCVKKYGMNEGVEKLLEVLDSEKKSVLFSSSIDDFVDVTAFNRKLNILMYIGLVDIIDYTVEEFKKCYEMLGHTVFLLDISERNTNVLKEYSDIVKRGIDFVQIFNNNNYKVSLRESGKDYLELLRIPCYDYMFDHPMYFQSFFNSVPDNYIVTCVDRNHNRYLNRFYDRGIKNFFLPLGSDVASGEDILWANRPRTALYVGSLKKNNNLVNDELSVRITEFLIQNTDYTTEDAIELCYKESVNPQATQEEIKQVIEKYRYVDMNVNYFFRRKLVETLVLNGIDVEVYGYGWEEVPFFDNPHFRYGGWISQSECLNLMKETKFVLNSMPWFKDGIHDRVYNAILAKSVCITDTSKYMEEQFKDRENLVLYKLGEMEKIPEIIHYYEDNPDEAARIADNGFEKVIVKHTWQNRAIELLGHYFDSV